MEELCREVQGRAATPGHENEVVLGFTDSAKEVVDGGKRAELSFLFCLLMIRRARAAEPGLREFTKFDLKSGRITR